MQAECVVEVKSFAGIESAALAPVIDAIVSSPYIAQRVSHDHRTPGFIDHPDVTYYGAFVDGELVGAYCVIASGFIEVDIHAFLLPSALKQSRDLLRMVIDSIFENADINRITAQILEGLETTKNHCARVGFVYEGFRRGAALKGGIPIGIHVLGITRQDWESLK